MHVQESETHAKYAILRVNFYRWTGGGGAVNCAVTTSGNRPMKGNISSSMYTQLAEFYTGIEGNYARISLL